MRKVLINAITIKEGGGAVVFIYTLNEMLRLERNIQWIVIVDEMLKNRINHADNITLLTFPWIKKSPFHFLYWNEITLPALVRQEKIDCLFSQVNTLPIRQLSCPTLLSILHAGYFSAVFSTLTFKYNKSLSSKIGWFLRKNWVTTSLKKATEVVAPTQALADDIIFQLGMSKNKMRVVVPGPGLTEGAGSSKQKLNQGTTRIGYITKYGVQKNFEVLFKAAAQLKEKEVAFKLILTLDPQRDNFRHVNFLIEQYQIGDIIENHGEINTEQTNALFKSLDIFIFPSLCESIGFTLLEAMYHGLPVIAAETKSNCELLGNEGVFFKPYDDLELFNKILHLIQDESHFLDQSILNIKRIKSFSWVKSAEETLGLIKRLSCATN